MSDFFTRLVARHLGHEQALSPRLPGLFEPEGQGRDRFADEAQERSAPSPVQAQAPDIATSPPVSATRMAPQGENMPVKDDHGRSLRSDQGDLAEPRHGPPAEGARDAGTVSVSNFTQETQVIHQHTHLHPDPNAQGQPDSARRNDHQEAQTHRPPEQDRAAEPAPQKTSPQPDPQQASKDETGPLPSPRMASLPEASALLPQPALPAAPTPDRRVEVQIGHLEIRQAPAVGPKQNARKRAASRNPGPDLKAYLGGRSG